MIYEYSDYRKYLKHLVMVKQMRNPQYSMRQIAQQLGLASSTFSEVLSGKRNLSFEMALSVALNIGLQGEEADYFCLLVKRQTVKSEEHRINIQKKLETLNPRGPVHSLEADMFNTISDWYHFAILSALEVDNIDKTIDGVAEYLQLSKIIVELALDRLQRLKLVRRNEASKFEVTTGDIFVNARVSSKGINKYHRQMLEKAAESIEGQALGERVFRTENIVVHEEQMAEADQIIEEFYAKMSKLTRSAKHKTTLYHLGTHFFKLSKTKTGVKKS